MPRRYCVTPYMTTRYAFKAFKTSLERRLTRVYENQPLTANIGMNEFYLALVP